MTRNPKNPFNPIPKHIIWDWNGTLLNDVDTSINAVNRLLSDARLPVLTRAAYLECFGFPMRDFYHRVGFPAEIPAGQWKSMVHIYHEIFNAGCPGIFPDARATLERLRDAGLSQFVLSALHQPLLLKTIHEYSVAPFFTRVCGADDLNGNSKLEKGRQLLRDIGLPPNEILLVGDTLHDAHVGLELGVQCALVSRGHQNATRLAAANVPVFPDLARVADEITRKIP